MVLSMYAAWLTLGATGNNVWLGVLAALAAGTALNAASTPLFLPFIRRRAYLEAMVISIGLSLIMVDNNWPETQGR
jgi:branched-subunit amino acid ABC-type transport system permease component